MEYASAPIIVVICYIIGEVYKIVFKKNKERYKYIPILLMISGGILGVLMYKTDKEMILNASNIFTSLGIGIVSGASSTGANQIIKQLFKKGEEKNENI